MSETGVDSGGYKPQPTPSEYLKMALSEFDGVTEENFKERIETGVQYVRAAKHWVDSHLLCSEEPKPYAALHDVIK